MSVSRVSLVGWSAVHNGYGPVSLYTFDVIRGRFLRHAERHRLERHQSGQPVFKSHRVCCRHGYFWTLRHWHDLGQEERQGRSTHGESCFVNPCGQANPSSNPNPSSHPNPSSNPNSNPNPSSNPN